MKDLLVNLCVHLALVRLERLDLFKFLEDLSPVIQETSSLLKPKGEKSLKCECESCVLSHEPRCQTRSGSLLAEVFSETTVRLPSSSCDLSSSPDSKC